MESDNRPGAQSEDNKCELRTLLDKAAEQLRIGYAYFYNRVALGNVLQEKPRVKEMAPAFFYLTLNSFRDSSILYLTSLLDKDNRTLRLDEIVNYLEDKKARFPNATKIRETILPDFRRRLLEIRKQTEAIRRVRHEEIAHLNLQNVVQGVTPGPIKADDVEKAYRNIHDALDELARACFGVECGIGMLEWNGKDFDLLIENAEVGARKRGLAV